MEAECDLPTEPAAAVIESAATTTINAEAETSLKAIVIKKEENPEDYASAEAAANINVCNSIGGVDHQQQQQQRLEHQNGVINVKANLDDFNKQQQTVSATAAAGDIVCKEEPIDETQHQQQQPRQQQSFSMHELYNNQQNESSAPITTTTSSDLRDFTNANIYQRAFIPIEEQKLQDHEQHDDRAQYNQQNYYANSYHPHQQQQHQHQIYGGEHICSDGTGTLATATLPNEYNGERNAWIPIDAMTPNAAMSRFHPSIRDTFYRMSPSSSSGVNKANEKLIGSVGNGDGSSPNIAVSPTSTVSSSLKHIGGGGGNSSNSAHSPGAISRLQCKKCAIIANNESELQEHFANVHGESPYGSSGYGSSPYIKEELNQIQQQQQQHQQQQKQQASLVCSVGSSGDLLDLDSQKMIYQSGGVQQAIVQPLHGWEQQQQQQHQQEAYQIQHTHTHTQSTTMATTSAATVTTSAGIAYVNKQVDNGDGAALTKSPAQFPTTTTAESPAALQTSDDALTPKSSAWKSNEARRPKTYNCTACKKWFTSSGHLKRHYNTMLHKNAVKTSGQTDPALDPISNHHHPSGELDGRGGSRRGGYGATMSKKKQQQEQKIERETFSTLQAKSPTDYHLPNMERATASTTAECIAPPPISNQLQVNEYHQLQNNNYAQHNHQEQQQQQQQQQQYLQEQHSVITNNNVPTEQLVGHTQLHQQQEQDQAIINGHPNGLAGPSVQIKTELPHIATPHMSSSQMRDLLSNKPIIITKNLSYGEDNIIISNIDPPVNMPLAVVYQQQEQEQQHQPEEQEQQQQQLPTSVLAYNLPMSAIEEMELITTVSKADYMQMPVQDSQPLVMNTDFMEPTEGNTTITTYQHKVSPVLHQQHHQQHQHHHIPTSHPQYNLHQVEQGQQLQQQQQPMETSATLMELQPLSNIIHTDISSNNMQQQFNSNSINTTNKHTTHMEHMGLLVTDQYYQMSNVEQQQQQHNTQQQQEHQQLPLPQQLQQQQEMVMVSSQDINTLIQPASKQQPQLQPVLINISNNSSNNTTSINSHYNIIDSSSMPSFQMHSFHHHTTGNKLQTELPSNGINYGFELNNNNAYVEQPSTTAIYGNFLYVAQLNAEEPMPLIENIVTPMTPTTAPLSTLTQSKQRSPAVADLPPTMFTAANAVGAVGAVVQSNSNRMKKAKQLRHKKQQEPQSPQLAQQQRQQKERPRVFCDLCDRSFTGPCYLTQHKKCCHFAGEYEYRCEICGKRYNNEEIFKTHVAKHSAVDKPFKCNLCAKQFHHKADLLRHHMLEHDKLGQMKCPVCEKGFARRDHLRKHVVTHVRVRRRQKSEGEPKENYATLSESNGEQSQSRAQSQLRSLYRQIKKTVPNNLPTETELEIERGSSVLDTLPPKPIQIALTN